MILRLGIDRRAPWLLLELLVRRDERPDFHEAMIFATVRTMLDDRVDPCFDTAASALQGENVIDRLQDPSRRPV